MAEGDNFNRWRDKKEEDEGEEKEEEPTPEEESQPEDAESPESTSEMLLRLLKNSLGLTKPEDKLQVLESLDLDGVAAYINSGKAKNIITMAGAGISTSAGIPDFRSPSTGLYANLQKYNLPSPTAIFEINFFKENPEPFFQLAKELWPGTYVPTTSHFFIKMLKDKGLLKRHYTQNVDTLERVAGLEDDDIVEAHGSFHAGHCMECGKEYSQEWMKEEIFSARTPKCQVDSCDGTIKPDIIFFGEALPSRFFQLIQDDFPECDLLIVMGTSLVVQPFASLVQRVPSTCPRLYINLEKPQWFGDTMLSMFGLGHGFNFDSEDNYRDLFWEGSCDDGCMELAKKIGWEKEFKSMIATECARLGATSESADAKSIDQDKPPTASNCGSGDGGSKM